MIECHLFGFWIASLMFTPKWSHSKDCRLMRMPKISNGGSKVWLRCAAWVEPLSCTANSNREWRWLNCWIMPATKVVRPAYDQKAKELALEEAKTRLRVASDEPDTERRLRTYRDARADFNKFIADNPGHPRLAEANLDVARILNLTGRTELNKALLAEDRKTRRELAAQRLELGAGG